MLGNGVGGKAHPLHPVPSPPPHIFIPCPPLCGTCAVRARRRHVHGRPTVRVGSARVASGGAGRVGMAAATSRGAPRGGGARRVRWRRGGGRAQGGRPSRDARAKTPPPALLEGSVPDPPAPALVQGAPPCIYIPPHPPRALPSDRPHHRRGVRTNTTPLSIWTLIPAPPPPPAHLPHPVGGRSPQTPPRHPTRRRCAKRLRLPPAAAAAPANTPARPHRPQGQRGRSREPRGARQRGQDDRPRVEERRGPLSGGGGKVMASLRTGRAGVEGGGRGGGGDWPRAQRTRARVPRAVAFKVTVLGQRGAARNGHAFSGGEVDDHIT